MWCRPGLAWVGAGLLLVLAGCGETARLTVPEGMGPRPVLPAPRPALLPTVHIAPAQGWPPGVTPQAADGLQVSAFASGLDHPRWLLVLPNGDVLVAESNAPPRTRDNGNVFDWVKGRPINHHWTKNLIASADGRTLYVTVGSNSNVAERGLDAEAGRAAIWAVDRASGAHRVFASGLRNPNGMAWEPASGVLWTV